MYTLLRLVAPLHRLVALLVPGGAGLYRKGTFAMLIDSRLMPVYGMGHVDH